MTCESRFFFWIIRWWGGVGDHFLWGGCQILDYHLDSSKLPCNLKHDAQVNITDVSEANPSIGIKQSNIVDVQLNEVKLFYSITPSQMVEYKKKCTQLSVIYEHVTNNSKPKLSKIHRIRSKPIRWLLLQFDQLSLIKGVLHHHTFMEDDETQQLVLPHCLWQSVLQSLHYDNGHQGLQHMIEFLRSKVYLPSMFADTDHWLSQCKRCHIAKDDYTEPKTQQGNLIANQLLSCFV